MGHPRCPELPPREASWWGRVLPLPPPVSLVPTPVAGRGASRPPWHRSAARAPLTLTSSVSALPELTRATPRATRAPTGTPTLLRRLGLLTVLRSVFS